MQIVGKLKKKVRWMIKGRYSAASIPTGLFKEFFQGLRVDNINGKKYVREAPVVRGIIKPVSTFASSYYSDFVEFSLLGSKQLLKVQTGELVNILNEVMRDPRMNLTNEGAHVTFTFEKDSQGIYIRLLREEDEIIKI